MGENSCIDRCVSKYWQASLFLFSWAIVEYHLVSSNLYMIF
jgi:hypothetical protein